MSANRKLDVEVAAELVPWLDEALASGQYNAPSDVVNDALRVLRHTRDMSQFDLETLGQLWREGLDSGPPVDAEPEFRRLLEKYPKNEPQA